MREVLIIMVMYTYIMIKDLRSIIIIRMFILKPITNKKILYHFRVKNMNGGMPERFIDRLITRILKGIFDLIIILNIIFFIVINSVINFNEMAYRIK